MAGTTGNQQLRQLKESTQHAGNLQNSFTQGLKFALIGLVLCAAISPQAVAHLMVALRGTLIFDGDGVHMVLSLPVSACENIDNDGDGKLPVTDFLTF